MPFYLSLSQAAEMQIVGFSGRKHCGKSTMGKYLIEEFGFAPEAFARHLKAEVVAFDGLPPKEVYGSVKSEHSRAVMVERGHGGRLKFGFDIWLKTTEANIYFGYDVGVRKIVLMDVRYPNEVEFIHALGGKVYRIFGRGDTESTEPGEIALDGYKDFDGWLDNSEGRTLDAVYADLRKMLAQDYGLLRRAA